MSEKIKIFLKLSTLTLIVYLFFDYTKDNLDKFDKIKYLEYSHFATLSLILLLEFLIASWIFKIIMNHFKIKLNFNEWFGLTILNSFYNYFFIKSGLFVRGHYLKKKHNLTYKNYIISFFLLSLIQVVCVSTISIISLISQSVGMHTFNAPMFYFFISLIVVAIIPFIAPNKTLRIIELKSKKLNPVIKSWIKLRRSYRNIIILSLLMFFIVILSSLRIYMIYNILFTPILFSSAVIITSIGYLSLFISLTPASLGIREALMSYAAELEGESFSTAIAVASLDRAIIMFWVFLLGIIFSFWYFKNGLTKNSK